MPPIAARFAGSVVCVPDVIVAEHKTLTQAAAVVGRCFFARASCGADLMPPTVACLARSVVFVFDFVLARCKLLTGATILAGRRLLLRAGRGADRALAVCLLAGVMK